MCGESVESVESSESVESKREQYAWETAGGDGGWRWRMEQVGM